VSLAKLIYEEACAYLEIAEAVDTSLMHQKDLELHELYVEYYQNIKDEIETASQSENKETPIQAAIRFIDRGMSTELIAKATGLDWLEVDSLRPKKKK
jgi:hypothetical protein